MPLFRLECKEYFVGGYAYQAICELTIVYCYGKYCLGYSVTSVYKGILCYGDSRMIYALIYYYYYDVSIAHLCEYMGVYSDLYRYGLLITYAIVMLYGGLGYDLCIIVISGAGRRADVYLIVDGDEYLRAYYHGVNCLRDYLGYFVKDDYVRRALPFLYGRRIYAIFQVALVCVTERIGSATL